MNLVGLGGLLTFNAGNSLGVMGSVRQAMAGLSATADGLTSSLRGVAVGLVPVVAGLGVAYKAALDFENQMAAVQAVTQGSTRELESLGFKAKTLGLQGSFTATQIAEGMELLSRAGFRTQEVLAGVGGVAAAAAADAMPMARAAEVIGSTIRGMGLKAEDMTRVADVMAYTSAASNTSINGLGYGFAYAQATARQLNVSLEATAAALGKISDSGYEDSVLGTSLTQMLNHLAVARKPQQKILTDMLGSGWRKQIAEAFTITPEEAARGVSAISKLVNMLEPRVAKYKTSLDRAAVQNQLFGVHGAKAWAALTAAGSTALEELTRANLTSQGAAQKMADMRLDSVIGEFKKLSAAVEGFSIGFFDKFLRPSAAGIRTIRELIGDIGRSTQLLRSADILDLLGPPTQEMIEKRVQWAGIGEEIKNFAMGVNTAIDTVVQKYTALKGFVQGLIASLVGDSDAAQQQWLGRMLTYAALAAPVLLGLTTVVLGLGAAFAVMAPLGGAVVGLLGGLGALLPTLGGLAKVVFAFMVFRGENEAVGDTLLRIWRMITSAVSNFWNNVLVPVITGLRDGLAPAMGPVWESWKSIFTSIRMFFADTLGFFTRGAKSTQTDWYAVAKTIGEVVGWVLRAISKITEVLAIVVSGITSTVTQAALIIGNFLLTPFKMVTDEITGLGKAITSLFEGDFKGAVTRFAQTIVDVVLRPMREIVKMFVEANDFFGRETSAGMRAFAYGSEVGAFLPQIAPGEKNMSSPTDGVAESMSMFGAAQSLPPVLSAEVILNDQRSIDVKVENKVDGKTLSKAVASHTVEIQERSGFKSTPWQRKAAVDFSTTINAR